MGKFTDFLGSGEIQMLSEETHDDLQEWSSKIGFSASGVAMRLFQGLHRAKRELRTARRP